MKVFFYEAFAEEAERLRHYLPDNLKAGFTEKTIQEYGAVDPPAPLISLRTQSVIPLPWRRKMKALLTRSTGYDHIKQYWKDSRKRIPAGYLPLYCHRAVAEQAFLLCLALSRKLKLQEKQFHHFHRNGLTGFELKDKTLVVVGVGNIGYEAYKIGKALEMRVFGVDIVRSHSDVAYLPIEKALPEADILLCAMDLNRDNNGYFSAQRLKQTPKGALFINISRGELSPPQALLKLVEENHLGGVGLDVYDRESDLAAVLRNGSSPTLPEVRALLDLAEKPNVILTPHNAFNTREAIDRKAKQSIEQITSFLEKGQFIWPVKE